MVAPDLVIGAFVRRPQIDVFVPVALKAECDSDEAARRGVGTRCCLASQECFDRPVVKMFSFENGVGFAIGDVRKGLQPDGPLSLVLDAGDGGAVGFQLHSGRRGAQRAES